MVNATLPPPNCGSEAEANTSATSHCQAPLGRFAAGGIFAFRSSRAGRSVNALPTFRAFAKP
jgi:hypothetical protein